MKWREPYVYKNMRNNRPRQLIAKITRSLGSATKIINKLQFLWEKGTCGCKNSLHFTFWPSDDFRRSRKCKSTKLHLHFFFILHFHAFSSLIPHNRSIFQFYMTRRYHYQIVSSDKAKYCPIHTHQYHNNTLFSPISIVVKKDKK